MNARGIVVMRGDGKVSMSHARKLGLQVQKGGNWSLPWGYTLFVSADYTVPWDLLPSGFHFLERWDAAAPLWRYGVLAADLGTAEERKRTEAVTLDLRLLVYEPGLLFVRANAAGMALMKTWRGECRYGDERLAFLRALHMVKPQFCALPRSWLAEEEYRAQHDVATARSIRKTFRPLVSVEIAPGRSVKCHAGDEEKVKAYYATLQGGRRQGSGGAGEQGRRKRRKGAEDKMKKGPAEDKTNADERGQARINTDRKDQGDG